MDEQAVIVLLTADRKKKEE